MPKSEVDYTTVRVAKKTATMLKVLQGRAFVAREHVTYDDLIAYMIATQYPDVYKQTMELTEEK